MKRFAFYVTYLFLLYSFITFCFFVFVPDYFIIQDSDLVITSASPDNSCEITLRSKPGFWGGSSVYVFYRTSTSKKLLFEEMLLNDKTFVDTENYTITWKTNTLVELIFTHKNHGLLIPNYYVIDFSDLDNVNYKSLPKGTLPNKQKN